MVLTIHSRCVCVLSQTFLGADFFLSRSPRNPSKCIYAFQFYYWFWFLHTKNILQQCQDFEGKKYRREANGEEWRTRPSMEWGEKWMKEEGRKTWKIKYTLKHRQTKTMRWFGLQPKENLFHCICTAVVVVRRACIFVCWCWCVCVCIREVQLQQQKNTGNP